MKHIPIMCIFTVIALVTVLNNRASAQELALGVLIPKVSCLDNTAQSYALYLPTHYNADKKWPIIFCFSPAARGADPVSLLQKAAEKYGYILVGSNNARNGPGGPITTAVNAIWRDAHARFSSDHKRVYATGFSGGARVAMQCAQDFKIAGVIACGAINRSRDPATMYPAKGSGLTIFGLVGNSCFNYQELLAADDELEKRAITHWIRYFSGGHQWPAAELMTEAVEFMHLQAMNKKLLPQDNDFIQTIIEQRIQSAKKDQEAGHHVLALQMYRNLHRLFADNPEVKKLKTVIAELEANPDVVHYFRILQNMDAQLSTLRGPGSAAAKKAAIDSFSSQSKATGNLATLAATHLHMVARSYVQSAMQAMQAKKYKQALQTFALLSDAFPNEINILYNVACCHARLKHPQQAIDFLSKAIDAGYTEIEHMKKDSDLDTIRSEAGYLQLLKKIKP